MKRASKLATDASPETVAKGAELTATGKLSPANWEDLAYHGFAGQQVKLQFKKAGAAHYSVKTVTSGTHGNLSPSDRHRGGQLALVLPGTTTTASSSRPGTRYH